MGEDFDDELRDFKEYNVMKYLLDTHALLWFLARDKRLSDRARQFIENPSNEIFLSIVSLWEIAIKGEIRETPFTQTVRAIVSRGTVFQ